MNIYIHMSQPNTKINIITIRDLYELLYIIPGAHETNSLDKVNQTTRFKKCPSDMLSFDLGKKVGYLTNQCSGLDKTALRDPACTYNNILQFTGNDLQDSFNKKIPFNTFWKSFCSFILNLNIGIESIDNGRHKNKTKNFYLATHHNRIKKTILQKLLNKKEKINFANCSCLKISITQSNVEIKCIFSGFPDKDGNYIEKGTTLHSGDTKTFGFDNRGISQFKKELLKIFKDILQQSNINIYIIRHGNAFHNAPLKLGNRNPLSRPLDSCLTPLGILQATQLAKSLRNANEIKDDEHNFYCSSYMNRAQLTIAEVAAGPVDQDVSIQMLEQNKLVFFRGLMRKMSLARLYRRLGANLNKWEDSMMKLAGSKAATNIDGNTQQIFNKLMSFSKNVEKYYNSCQQFMTLPIIRIPASGKLEMKPALLTNSPTVNYRVHSPAAAAGGARKYTRKKARKQTKKKRAYKRKKRTKKYALKKRHWRNLFN